MGIDSYSQDRKNSLEKKLAAYSAAAGAALVSVAPVDAQVIYTDVFPDHDIVIPLNIDFNQDAFPDLVIERGLGVEAAGKGEVISYYAYIGPVPTYYPNPVLTQINVFGTPPGPTCNYGVAVGAATCESPSLIPSCAILYQPGSAQKVETVAAPTPVSIPAIIGYHYIKFGGLAEPPTSATGKFASSVPVPWQGWIRVEVSLAPGKTSGDTAIPFQILVKDYAFFGPDVPIICDAAALPVELVSFEAVQDGGDLKLVWETASEINNAGFEIQHRRAETEIFAALDFVEGAGTTMSSTSYSHTVEGLEPGRYFFRLKQIDLDGAFEYSSEIEALVEVPGSHFLSDAYPNPFNPQAQFSLVVPSEQTVKVELFDATGRSISVLYEGTVVENMQARFVVRGDDLPSGTYLYRVTGENFTETKTIVLAK
jgi:hypothetical protein